MNPFLAGFSITGKFSPSPRMAAACESSVGPRQCIPSNVLRATDFEPVLIFGGRKK
jgi:hypothetical protein